MTGRSVPEWIGKTPDTPAPPRVRLRILETWGRRCYLSGREIRAGDVWHLEHVKALTNGGENRESNLAPALVEPHREKTRRDVALKKKTSRTRKKHFGIKGKKRPMAGSRASPFKQRLGSNGTYWERRT